MSEDIPLWVAIIIAVLLVGGAGLTFIGIVGLTIFKNFFDRLHAPTLGTTWGIGAIIIASIIFSSFVAHHLIVRELLLTIFLVVTTPVTVMLLSRAAIQRDETHILKKFLRKNETEIEKD